MPSLGSGLCGPCIHQLSFTIADTWDNQFGVSSSWLMDLIAFGPVTRQHIVVGERGRAQQLTSGPRVKE
jgi:hypothetical protein